MIDGLQRINKPFPHWVMDDAITAKNVAQILAEWPSNDAKWHKENGKFQKKWSIAKPEGRLINKLIGEATSKSFCKALGKLIGVDGLMPDPDGFGGGLHAIPPGGFLNMHCDFRFHPNRKKRIANLLLFLNPEWKEEWGGHLVLGDDSETQCRYLPIAGRAVIFRTDEQNWHGHPEPLTCPENVMRRSIAVYYYTDERGTPDTTRYVKR